MTTLDRRNDQKIPTRILVVDDHPIVRQGLSQLLSQEKDFLVCGEAADAKQALAAIRLLQPSLAIIDLALGGASGLDLIKTIHAEYPELQILALSMYEESLYAERVLHAGARGYIMKQEAPDRIVAAIRRLLRGDIYLSKKMGEALLKQLATGRPPEVSSPLGRLSDRELEVFRLIGQGISVREVAQKLHLSVKTIETHREHIKKKLHLKNSRELLQYAIHLVQSEGLGRIRENE